MPSFKIMFLDYLVVRQLVKQGARWVQSQCEPLCQLQAMVQDAEMCSTVASQIVNIKCRTRYTTFTCLYRHIPYNDMWP